MALQGCGLGLRSPNEQQIFQNKPPLNWLEVISEHYMDTAGKPLKTVENLRKTYPVVLRGLSLSAASSDDLNTGYLKSLSALIRRLQPELVVEHMSWSSIDRIELHEQLPFPLSEESFDLASQKIEQAQDFLQRRIYIKNIPSYLTFAGNDFTEWEFLNRLAETTGCGIIPDVTSMLINAGNGGSDPQEYIHGIQGKHVGYVHLTGCTDMGGWLCETPDKVPGKESKSLYQAALSAYGRKAVCMECEDPSMTIDQLTEETEALSALYQKASERESSRAPNIRRTDQRQSRHRTASELNEVRQWIKNTVLYPAKYQQHRTPDCVLLTESTAQERLNVYKGGYPSRIHQALLDCYEALSGMVGEKTFLNLSVEYASAFPSGHYNLMRAGDRFPEFLEHHPIIQELPFVGDLAQLEKRLWHASHANDGEPIGSEILSKYHPEDWEKLTFEFQPSFDLMESEWPIVYIWNHRSDAEIESALKFQPGGCKVMIYRKDYDAGCADVDSESAWKILTHLYKGQKLGEALEKIGDDSDDVLADLTVYFQKWTDIGIFCGVEVI